jgi:hypothetical protein
MSIKYILIGNAENGEEIGHYPERVSKSIASEPINFFKELINDGNFKKDKRGRHKLNDTSFYYYIIDTDNIFYLIYGEDNLKEYDAFDLIEYLKKNNIPPLIDSKIQKFEEKQKFKEKVEYFINNKMNKIRNVEIQVNEVKGIMKENINEMASGIVKIQDLEDKSNEIKENAIKFHSGAKKARLTAIWQTWKWLIIFIIVIILLIIIIVPISLKKKKK